LYSRKFQKESIGVHWKAMASVNDKPDAAVIPIVTKIMIRSAGKTLNWKIRR
jgi:hypothetical protein